MTLPIKYIAPVLKPDYVFTEGELLIEIVEDLEGALQLIEAIQGNRTFLSDDDYSNIAKIRSAYMRHAAKLIYKYAVNGIFPEKSEHIECIDSAFLDFSALCLASRSAAEMYGSQVPLRAEKTMAMAILRARLDSETIGQYPDVVVLEPLETNFTLFEIAVLAQMNEKSVRNATQKRANDQLMTIRVGTRTYVEPGEALRWLNNRRSFHSTVIRTEDTGDQA
jgi:hypothetical protein